MNYLSKFPYAWRFTDEKYNKLDLKELEQMFELTEKESIDFWSQNIESKINIYPISNIYKTNKKIINDCGWGDKEGEESTRVLLKNIQDENKEIYFFWGKRYAIKTYWDLFVKYWSDFCYCSDTGNVIFLSCNNILIYYEDTMYTMPN